MSNVKYSCIFSRVMLDLMVNTKITWVQSHIVGFLLSKGYRSCELYSPSQTSNRIQHSGCDGDVDTEHHRAV